MLGIKKKVVDGQKCLCAPGLCIPYHTKQVGLGRRFCIGSLEIPYHISPVLGIPLPFDGDGKDAPEQRLKLAHYRQAHRWNDPRQVQHRLEEMYLKRMGRPADLNNPRTFTEKLNWLKLHYREPMITVCCDKYAVKDHVADHLGASYQVPTIRAWTSAREIDFDALPRSFVLKVNWSSGYNIVVPDKTTLSARDKKRILARLDHWMQPMCNSYYDSFNWGYKDCTPVVYAEEYLDPTCIVQEYKVFCFHGRAEFVLIEQNAPPQAGARACVDRDGLPLPLRFGQQEKLQTVQLPEDFSRLPTLAERLAAPFPFVRVDFLGTPQRRMVGEMTFYSGGGFSEITPEGWDEKLGGLLRLDEIEEHR